MLGDEASNYGAGGSKCRTTPLSVMIGVGGRRCADGAVAAVVSWSQAEPPPAPEDGLFQPERTKPA
ncbi:hypothetical protein UK82_12515 [Frankia sp. ACN1ag]|nr:hypothetical protein UK82_12515 [Frankia sp. ACN1ag]